MSDSTCKTCRHHSEEKRPRPQQAVVSVEADYVGVAFSDVDEVMYSCRAPRGPYAGREVGFDAVTCDAYEAGTRISKSQGYTLDEAVQRMELRLAARQKARRDADSE